MDYEVKHIGDGKFEVTINGDVKEAGPNLCGMIRYTYFEDFSYPPIGWSTNRLKLLEDYNKKVIPDIMSGKIKLGKHEFNNENNKEN